MKSKILALATTAVLACSAANAAIVSNGSFEEDPGVLGKNGNTFASMPGASGGASWDIWTGGLPGWTVTGGVGLELQTANTIPLTPYDGDYYLELDSDDNSAMEQVVTLASPGRYELSFAFSPRVDSPTTNAVNFGIDGLFFDTVNGPSVDYPLGEWALVTYEFTVGAAGAYTLFFDATSVSDSFGGFVDDVQISAVPVPAAGGLLMLALAGLGAAKRRKKA